MAKIKNPIKFSRYFKVSKNRLSALGAFDPILNVDTKLFIDPLLLSDSNHSEMRDAENTYKYFFAEIIKLLDASKNESDIAWRTAYKKLLFREIKGTCLGYGAASIRGSGFGPKLTKQITNTAKEIIDIGVKDPDLFIALPLLEENVGPDLISDMTTNIIIEKLIRFNERILSKLKIPTEKFDLKGYETFLALNPKESARTPVILVPEDVLRELPTANDWDDICRVAYENQILRDKVNKLIGKIWKAKTRKDKKKIRAKALSSNEAFTTLMDTIHRIEPRSYDLNSDPEGILVWQRIHETIADEYPFKIKASKSQSLEELYDIVKLIVEQFQHLIEKRGLSRELWHKGKRRNEKSVQRIFFAVADSYCKANDLDISPEVDVGTGQIDFKFSRGYENRILIEVKLSDNPKLVQGYEKQLEAYKDAERTLKALFLVIDIGKMGEKDEKLFKLKNVQASKGLPVSDILFINGEIRKSASRL